MTIEAEVQAAITAYRFEAEKPGEKPPTRNARERLRRLADIKEREHFDDPECGCPACKVQRLLLADDPSSQLIVRVLDSILAMRNAPDLYSLRVLYKQLSRRPENQAERLPARRALKRLREAAGSALPSAALPAARRPINHAERRLALRLCLIYRAHGVSPLNGSGELHERCPIMRALGRALPVNSGTVKVARWALRKTRFIAP